MKERKRGKKKKQFFMWNFLGLSKGIIIGTGVKAFWK
jgi:hypothetical protein